MKSPADLTQRRLEFQDVLDTAIQHGMKVLGQTSDNTEYRWGARDDNTPMVRPALHALVYEGEELKWDDMVTKSISGRATWD